MATLDTTLGQLLINSALPEELRDYNRVLDKKGVKALFQRVGEEHPEKYREISHRISDIGRHVAYTTGGHSFGLQHLRTSIAGKLVREQIQKDVRGILAQKLPEAERNAQIVEAARKYRQQLVDAVYDESKGEGNPLAYQVMGAGRGNAGTLNSLRGGGDLLYADHRGEAIPMPVLRNYSEGLMPAEYFAGAFGARKGIIDLKSATADAGYYGKQLVQANHRLLVTAQDDDDPYDEASPRGFPTAPDDPDNEGALLARGIGGYSRNTQLTPKIMKDLKQRGFDEILVRSPTVGGPLDGGVYGRDVGRRERGDIAPTGDWVGVAAANAVSEPLTQAQIGSKHSGGVVGAAAGAIGGFKLLNNMTQVPKKFPGGAAHAQADGRVQGLVAAPQGGHYMTVDGVKHYLPVGAKPLVKPGDEVEAGDVLSDGIPNPAEVVKFKGIGEGRRYFVNAYREAMDDSNTFGHRRNIELVARGLINHVRLNDEVGDWAPDEVVPYQTLERLWQPRAGSVTVTPREAAGHYLERPILHYTIGTKVGPKVAASLAKHGVTTIQAHRDPPPFQPEFIRGASNVSEDLDWFPRFLGSGQQKGLLKAVHRNDTSDTNSTSFVPSLAEGADFGIKGPTQGWKP
jgi:DNA-directed RNA polymerase subunit beta'